MKTKETTKATTKATSKGATKGTTKKTTTATQTATQTATATASKPQTKKVITEADIRRRAQKIYENRLQNGISGDADSDWKQAEKELARM